MLLRKKLSQIYITFPSLAPKEYLYVDVIIHIDHLVFGINNAPVADLVGRFRFWKIRRVVDFADPLLPLALTEHQSDGRGVCQNMAWGKGVRLLEIHVEDQAF